MSAGKRIFIPFGEFSPDGGHLLTNGLVTAEGVLPAGDKFLPLPPMFLRSQSLSTDVLQTNRANVHVNPPGLDPGTKVYVVNGSKAYVVDASGHTNWPVTELTVGSGTVGIDSDAGSMFGFGQHEIIVQGHTNDILYRAFGAGNLEQLINPNNNLDLPSPPGTGLPFYPDRPKAKFGCPIGDRVLIGNIAFATPLAATTPDPNPDMLWWSKSRDASVFADEAHPADGRSGYTFLYDDHGPIMGLAGDKEYALIFKRRAIYRMDFTGSFGNTFRCIPQSYGTLSHRTIARLGNDVYFWSDAGPCVYRSDQVFQLSAGRISAFLTGNVFAQVSNSLDAFYGASVDIVNQTVTWLFSYTQDGGDVAKFMLLTYNAALDIFSVPFNLEFGPSLSFLTPFDTSIAATPYVLFDGFPENSPKNAFTGALMLVDVYSQNGVPPTDAVRLFSFDYTPEDEDTVRRWPQNVVLKTGFYSLGGQNSVLVKKVRPVMRAKSFAELPQIGVRLYTKQRPWDDPVDFPGIKYLSGSSDDRGFINVLGKKAQFQQFELVITVQDNETYASNVVEIEGLEVEFDDGSPNLGSPG